MILIPYFCLSRSSVLFKQKGLLCNVTSIVSAVLGKRIERVEVFNGYYVGLVP